MNLLKIFFVIFYLLSSSFLYIVSREQSRIYQLLVVAFICVIGLFVTWVLLRKKHASDSTILLMPGKDQDQDIDLDF